MTTAPVDDTTAAPSASSSNQEPSSITVPSGSASPASSDVVSRLSGSANRQSALFALPDGAVKIRYNTTGGNLTVRLLPESGQDTGDNFLCTSACDREADLIKEAGSYYLEIQSTGGDWNITVTA